MGAERATLYLVEENQLISRVLDGTEVSEIRLNLGQGIAGWVAQTVTPVLVPDAYQDERFDKKWDQRTGFRTRCVLCHPLVGRSGQCIGVVQVINRVDGGVFGDQDLELAGLLSTQLAMTIENSRLMLDLVDKNDALTEAKAQLELRNRELDLLLEIEQRVASADSLDNMLSSILGLSIDLTQASSGMLYRKDETGAEARVTVDCEEKGTRIVRIEPGTGLVGWVAERGEELLLADPQSDPRFGVAVESHVGVPLSCIAAVPLLSPFDGSPLGALAVANHPNGAFGEDDLALLRRIAARLSRAMVMMRSRAQRDRERRLATVGRLLAGVLHDLKSPISVIAGYAELLAEKCPDEENADYLAHIHKNLGRITTMAEDIVAFTRGERRILTSSVSVRELMDSFASGLKPLLTATNTALDIEVHTQGQIRVDTEKMLRAFHNIARNAVEAMRPGGKLSVAVNGQGQDVFFSFTDMGLGIPEQIQGAIFESFVTLGKKNGTGLGLAVAREVVEAHGGSISFKTKRGHGTTFTIRLPV
jgi:signal transduction histidine kinase